MKIGVGAVKMGAGTMIIGSGAVKIGTGTVKIGAAKTIEPLRTYKNYIHVSTLKIHDF